MTNKNNTPALSPCRVTGSKNTRMGRDVKLVTIAAIVSLVFSITLAALL